jgi:hypothetical protein
MCWRQAHEQRMAVIRKNLSDLFDTRNRNLHDKPIYSDRSTSITRGNTQYFLLPLVSEMT